MWSIEDIFSTLLADQQVLYALKAKVFCGTSVNIVYYYYTFFPYYSAKSLSPFTCISCRRFKWSSSFNARWFPKMILLLWKKAQCVKTRFFKTMIRCHRRCRGFIMKRLKVCLLVVETIRKNSQHLKELPSHRSMTLDIHLCVQLAAPWKALKNLFSYLSTDYYFRVSFLVTIRQSNPNACKKFSFYT